MIESNKLIAKFMGYKPHVNEGAIQLYKLNNSVKSIGELNYHTSWDLLMLVVEKIESLGHMVEIFQDSCDIFHINHSRLGVDECIYVSTEDTKLQAVYIACIEYVKWYNKQ